MAYERSETAEKSDNHEGLISTVASLLVGSGFFAFWFWLLPGWLGFQVDIGRLMHWRWIAVAPSMLGFAVALRCIWDFGRTGHGTPAPFAPPRRLVITGVYRYVRNPMYLGFFTGWIGLWIVFGKANWIAIATAFAVVACTALFVRLYEEPALRKTFGAAYEEYCQNVRRWLPRFHAWNP